jgi:hypothetical protein
LTCDLAKLNGNEAAFRASEDDAFIAGLANDLETAFFYASTKTDPERIMGLSPRLDSTLRHPLVRASRQQLTVGVGE